MHKFSGNCSQTRSRCLPGIAGVFPVVGTIDVPGWLGPEAALIAIGVAMLVGVGWWSWREYRRNQTQSTMRPPLAGAVEDGGARLEAADSAAKSGPEGGFVRSSTPEEETSPERALFSTGGLPPRSCPECERTFPGFFDVCPFDSSSLVEQNDAIRDSSRRRLPRRYCPDCGRRYELNATHCYHDGRKLQRDREKASMGAPIFRVCRDCGWEGAGQDHRNCPNDGGPLVDLDPMRRQQIRPPFPYNRCRECGYVGGPDETKCPTDGSFLLPELSARLTALPPTGYGPRRRICPDCGAQFADHCNYCSGDGTELISLN